METALLIAVTLLAIIVLYWFLQGKHGQTPPGPVGLPLVGYLPFITFKPYVKFKELKEKYGPVYSLRLGSIDVVVLNDFESIKTAFMQDAFMGRPPELVYFLSEECKKSGAFNGMPWKEHKNLSLHLLRDVGFGKSRMEDHIKDEINDLLDRFAETKGEPTELATFLVPSMSNNISSLVFGRRMKYEDPKRIILDAVLTEFGQLSGQSAWQMFFPTLRNIADFLHLGSVIKIRKCMEKLQGFFWNEVNEHEKNLEPDNIRDLIDGYLLEIQKRKNDPSFNKPILVDLLVMFFGAGSDTVRLTVEWLLLTMAAYEDVQKKVQAEIDEVIGRERFPTSADRMKMPYTEAAIMEIMRWITIIPLNLTRYTIADTKLNGYFIPKHTTIIANLWGVHHDQELWGSDIDVYRPERFLSEDGKTLKKIDHFIPFSIGKRACPGEMLGKVEVFLYFTAILQKFNVRLPDGHTPDFEGILGIGLVPKGQALQVLKRQ